MCEHSLLHMCMTCFSEVCAEGATLFMCMNAMKQLWPQYIVEFPLFVTQTVIAM